MKLIYIKKLRQILHLCHICGDAFLVVHNIGGSFRSSEVIRIQVAVKFIQLLTIILHCVHDLLEFRQKST